MDAARPSSHHRPEAALLTGALADAHLAAAPDPRFRTGPIEQAPQTCADCGRENTGDPGGGGGGGGGGQEPQTCADCGRDSTGG